MKQSFSGLDLERLLIVAITSAFVSIASDEPCIRLWRELGGKEPMKGAAKIVKDAGYVYLEQKTLLTKLLSIVKSGGIVTGDKVPVPPTGVGYGSNMEGRTHFFLTKNTEPPSAKQEGEYSIDSISYPKIGGEIGSLDAAIIVVDIDAMENARFHVASVGRRYGTISERDYRSSDPLTELTALLQNGCGEVVFYQDIPSKSIRAYWVHPSKRQEVIETFRKASITQVNGIAIESFVVSPP